MFGQEINRRNGWTSATVHTLAFAGLAMVLSGATISAQETSRFTFDIGGGFTQPVGNTARRLDTGWNLKGGAGFNFNRYVGTVVEAGYNRFDINSGTLRNAGFQEAISKFFRQPWTPSYISRRATILISTLLVEVVYTE